MLVHSNGSLETLGYTGSNFQGDSDSSKIVYEEKLADPFREACELHGS